MCIDISFNKKSMSLIYKDDDNNIYERNIEDLFNTLDLIHNTKELVHALTDKGDNRDV